MLGIVILNYQTWELTIECVRGIKENLKLEYKIFIVDNASPNHSYEKLKDAFRDDASVKCILSKRNGGYSRGNNIGIKACQKEHIAHALITNNDVEFYGNAIFQMQETLIKNPTAVIVSPKILSKDGKVNSCPFNGLPTLWQFLGIGNADRLLLDADKVKVKKTTKVYSVPGSCMMIDVDKFIKMGAFDPGTFMYCEEVIVAKLAERSGYDILFEPEAKIIHNHGASAGLGNTFVESNVLCSALYYWRKYEDVSNFKLYVIYYYFLTKMLIKVLLGKVDRHGWVSAVKKCRRALKKTLQIR